MKAARPTVIVPGDNFNRIMAQAGTCIGMSDVFAVWRFGFLRNSYSHKAYGVYHTGDFFLWVLAYRESGRIIETCEGAAIELPHNYREVIDWEP